MDANKRYHQLNDLILFVKKNDFNISDPVFITVCEAIRISSTQINNKIANELTRKKSFGKLQTIQIHSKLNFY